MPISVANNCNRAQGEEQHPDTVIKNVFCYILLPERPSYVQVQQQVIILYVLKTNVFLARTIVFLRMFWFSYALQGCVCL